MKKIIFLALLFWSAIVSAQPTTVPGYVTFNEKRNQLAIIARALNIPIRGTPALASGQPGIAGALVIDTTGGNKGLHGYWDGVWHRFVDTTWSGLLNLSSVGSAYKIAIEGTHNVKSLTATNGLTTDSATSGQVGITLGGSSITQVSKIGLGGGHPLMFVNSAVDTTSQTDSSSIYIANLASAPATSSAYVSPRLIFRTSGRKTTGGAAATDEEFIFDAYGRLQNPNGGAVLRLQSKSNGVLRNLYTITETGQFLQNLNIRAATFGISASTGGIAIGTGSPLQVETALSQNNLAVGNNALQANTDGSYNLAVGNNALLSNVIGNRNTAVGHIALSLNTSDFNTAVGAFAMANSTTAQQSAAFGYNALFAATTSIKNVAIGPGALEATTSGGFNTGVGEDVLLHNITGTDNIGVGWLANSLETASVGSIGMGNSSWRSRSKGSYSIAIGYQAGYLNSQIDSCESCILLGQNTYATANHQMILGDTALTSTFIRGARVGTTSDSVYVKKSDGSLGTVAQSSTAPALSSITAMTTSATINNADNPLQWQWNTLSSNTGFLLNSTSTAASSSTQVLFKANLTGANVNAGELTYTADIRNTHSGAGTNFALKLISSGGSTNYSLDATGQARFNTGINLNGSSSDLQLNGSAGTTDQELVSAGSGNTPTWKSASDSTYLPTLTNVTNAASSSVSGGSFHYIRRGSQVVISGVFTVTPTAGTTLTQVAFSLPVSSNFGVSQDATGTCVAIGSTYNAGMASADGTNDRIQLDFISSNTSAHTVSFNAMYTIK